ncbi:ATP-binding protein [Zavarzinia sp. CC-PAN008]|uniref:ATP-binding protein n=1 Tax=Zavarzinia sp. CC-PAN008 TaxID=3243332 RepID=UPI003F7490A5
MHDLPLRIGHLIEINGTIAVGRLDISFDEFYQSFGGDDYSLVQIGSIVKIESFDNVVFGTIRSVGLEAAAGGGPPPGNRIEIELFGEGALVARDNDPLDFTRGVSNYPAPGEAIFLAHLGELAQIFARPDKACVRVGTVYQDRRLPAYIMTDGLMSRHFAVLGTTGSGKSCSVALLLHAILDAHPAGHIILLDPHAEYEGAFGAKAEVIDPTNLHLPYWLLNLEETIEVVLGSESSEGEVAILKAALLKARQRAAEEFQDPGGITVDTPIPYRLWDLIAILNEEMGKLERPESTLPYLRIKFRLETLRTDQRFAFMFSGFLVEDTLVEMISRYMRIPVQGRPISVVDLSGVPSEVTDVVVSVLCRMVFDFCLWSPRGEAVPVLLICEEAHRYVPRHSEARFQATRKAIERIAKEGRKYGVSLGLVTQRPSELSETILSQCNTLISLRMSNAEDQDYVRRALPDAAIGLMNALSSLQAQEALVVGEGVTLPLRLRFDTLPEERRPRSSSVSFSRGWSIDTGRASFIEKVVERWREQRR